MSDWFQERYNPVNLGVNGSYSATSGSSMTLAGFLCKTGGTITATRTTSVGTIIIIDAIPVTAGVYYPMPFHLGFNSTVTLGGGAAGTLGIA